MTMFADPIKIHRIAFNHSVEILLRTFFDLTDIFHIHIENRMAFTADKMIVRGCIRIEAVPDHLLLQDV